MRKDLVLCARKLSSEWPMQDNNRMTFDPSGQVALAFGWAAHPCEPPTRPERPNWRNEEKMRENRKLRKTELKNHWFAHPGLRIWLPPVWSQQCIAIAKKGISKQIELWLTQDDLCVTFDPNNGLYLGQG